MDKKKTPLFRRKRGRCITGQAILLDSVISRICEDLEILHGMRNAWL